MQQGIETQTFENDCLCSGQLVRHDHAYVDKTKFIEILERGRILYPYIVRPHNFGKTLFTYILQAYYDKALADQFDRNFKGTYIFDHKTELANSLRVLHIDFSHLNLDSGVEVYLERVKAGIADFATRYPNKKADELLKSKYSSLGMLLDDFLIANDNFNEPQLFVIIDENAYYHSDFANLYNDGPNSALLRELNGFFLNLKSATVNNNVDRVFTTGTKATDVRSDDIAPYPLGFDIVRDISAFPQYASMFGFTRAELVTLIHNMVNLEQLGFGVDEVVAGIQQALLEYQFSRDSDITGFEPVAVFNFLQQFSSRIRVSASPGNGLG